MTTGSAQLAAVQARLGSQRADVKQYMEWVNRLEPEFANLPKGTIVVINARTGDYVVGTTLLEAADEFERRFKGDVGYAHEIGGGFFVGGGIG